MAKTMTMAELLAAMKDGGSIDRDDNKIELLVKSIYAMIEENKQSHERHLAALNANLTKIANKLGNGSDVKEMTTLLTTIASNTQYERPSYKFEFERDTRTQYVKSVIARPVTKVH